MTQVVIHKVEEKSNTHEILVGSDAENALPANIASWTELAGLSWIFVDNSLENYA